MQNWAVTEDEECLIGGRPWKDQPSYKQVARVRKHSLRFFHGVNIREGEVLLSQRKMRLHPTNRIKAESIDIG